MNSAELAKTLETIAQNFPMSVKSCQGDDQWFATCFAKVTVRKDRAVIVSVDVNATISEREALAIVGDIRKSFGGAEGSAEVLVEKKSSNHGYWHMGRFCATRVSRTYYPTDTTAPRAVAHRARKSAA